MEQCGSHPRTCFPDIGEDAMHQPESLFFDIRGGTEHTAFFHAAARGAREIAPDYFRRVRQAARDAMDAIPGNSRELINKFKKYFDMEGRSGGSLRQAGDHLFNRLLQGQPGTQTSKGMEEIIVESPFTTSTGFRQEGASSAVAAIRTKCRVQNIPLTITQLGFNRGGCALAYLRALAFYCTHRNINCSEIENVTDRTLDRARREVTSHITRGRPAEVGDTISFGAGHTCFNCYHMLGVGEGNIRQTLEALPTTSQ